MPGLASKNYSSGKNPRKHLPRRPAVVHISVPTARPRAWNTRQNNMPKMKSHSGAKKRFIQTATGRFKYQRINKRHLLTGRSQKRKRHLRLAGYVGPQHHHQIAKLLPYGVS